MTAPIIIIGAPRSGTSLMHMLLRGCGNTVSVPKDSAGIWHSVAHPKYFGWEGEQAPERISERKITHIRREFRGSVYSSKTWRKLDSRGILNIKRRPVISRLFVRPAYAAQKAIRKLIPIDAATSLVDKSIHSSMWLPLVDQVFPDAKFIFIQRNPVTTIEAMIDAWLRTDRFVSFRVPKKLSIPDYPDRRRWNFVLPCGWKSYTDQPLARVVAFQFAEIMLGISRFQKQNPDRVLTVPLERLSADPELQIERLGRWLGPVYHDDLAQYLEAVPRVNQRLEGGKKYKVELLMSAAEAWREIKDPLVAEGVIV